MILDLEPENDLGNNQNETNLVERTKMLCGLLQAKYIIFTWSQYCLYEKKDVTAADSANVRPSCLYTCIVKNYSISFPMIPQKSIIDSNVEPYAAIFVYILIFVNTFWIGISGWRS